MHINGKYSNLVWSFFKKQLYKYTNKHEWKHENQIWSLFDKEYKFDLWKMRKMSADKQPQRRSYVQFLHKNHYQNKIVSCAISTKLTPLSVDPIIIWQLLWIRNENYWRQCHSLFISIKQPAHSVQLIKPEFSSNKASHTS